MTKSFNFTMSEKLRSEIVGSFIDCLLDELYDCGLISPEDMSLDDRVKIDFLHEAFNTIFGKDDLYQITLEKKSELGKTVPEKLIEVVA